jgi:hypothetical protein
MTLEQQPKQDPLQRLAGELNVTHTPHTPHTPQPTSAQGPAPSLVIPARHPGWYPQAPGPRVPGICRVTVRPAPSSTRWMTPLLRRPRATEATVVPRRSFYDSYLELDRPIFFLTQTIVRGMVDQGRGGAIVNIGSMWAYQAIAATPSSAFSVAKPACTP